MQDTASHGAPKLDNDELRHTLSVHDVGAQLEAAGVARSRRQIIRYCETGMLDAQSSRSDWRTMVHLASIGSESNR